MSAVVRKIGGPDTGHVGAICEDPECRDLNGRPWQVWHSRRTVEGVRLAERDAAAHNVVTHLPADAPMPGPPRGLCAICRRGVICLEDHAGVKKWQHADGGPDGLGSDHRPVLLDPLGCGHPGEVGL